MNCVRHSNLQNCVVHLSYSFTQSEDFFFSFSHLLAVRQVTLVSFSSVYIIFIIIIYLILSHSLLYQFPIDNLPDSYKTKGHNLYLQDTQREAACTYMLKAKASGVNGIYGSLGAVHQFFHLRKLIEIFNIHFLLPYVSRNNVVPVK